MYGILRRLRLLWWPTLCFASVLFALFFRSDHPGRRSWETVPLKIIRTTQMQHRAHHNPFQSVDFLKWAALVDFQELKKLRAEWINSKLVINYSGRKHSRNHFRRWNWNTSTEAMQVPVSAHYSDFLNSSLCAPPIPIKVGAPNAAKRIARRIRAEKHIFCNDVPRCTCTTIKMSSCNTIYGQRMGLICRNAEANRKMRRRKKHVMRNLLRFCNSC